MSKVIDLRPRLKTVAATTSFGAGSENSLDHNFKTEVVKFEEQRQRHLFQERRQVKRTILSEIVSAMVVIPEKGLLKVEIYDISEEGISFDLSPIEGQFQIGEEILMRVYLNQKTYFPVQLNVKHITEDQNEVVLRHGAEFSKGTANDVALQHFIRFVETIGQGLKKDSGDLMINRIS